MVVDTTLYNRLEIEPTDNESIIKKAYFKLSRQWHPDKNPNNINEATKKFQEISEAYEILRDNEKRNKYNKFGMGMIKNNGTSMDPNDIFKHFMGNMGNRFKHSFSQSFNFNQRTKPKEEDIIIALDITLEDIFHERTKDLKYNIKIFCNNCNGTGSSTKEKKICNICNGTGQAKRIIKQGFIIQQISHPCNNCNASGKIVNDKDKCNTCNKQGFIIKSETINMTIKKTIFNGKKVVLKERGNKYATKTTNLVIMVRIKQDPKYNIINNNNILMEMEIDLIDSIIGFTKEIIYLDGNKYNITYNKGDSISDGDIKVIPNLGLYNNNRERGDILIKFKVKPIKIDQINKNDIKHLCKIFKKKIDFINNNTILELSNFDETKFQSEEEHHQTPECHQQ